MTFSEVVISALILGISAQTSLRGWTGIQAKVQTAMQREHQLQTMERRLLLSQRLLALGTPVDHRCRFDIAAVQSIFAQRPIAPDVSEQLEWRPDLEGLWLSLTAGPSDAPWRRRRLFTPAGLGLCHQEVE